MKSRKTDSWFAAWVAWLAAGCGQVGSHDSPQSASAGATRPTSPAKSSRTESRNEPPAIVCSFRDIAEEVGVQFSYYNGAKGRMHIWETMGGGVAMIDFDGDGWPDLFFTDGRDDPRDASDREHRGRLFRNQGGEFVDATESAGLEDFAYGQGAAVGDFDNDGFDDLFVTHVGSTALFHNHGDGTFSDVTAEASVSCPLWSTACAFGDLSSQGQLDLFVTGYLEVDPDHEPTCRDRRGTPTYCGPQHFKGQSFRLFQNQGDGTFVDRSEAAGVVVPQSKGLAAAILDLDDDGTLDIFAVNDAEPGRLFRNQGACRFVEGGLNAGLAYTGDGQVYNGMGIACGDYDGDGRVDLCVTNFFEKGALLFRNRGRGMFRETSVASGIGSATRPRLSFGTEFLDFDNDGWLDLFLANGHISDLRADGIPYAMKAQLFHNTGKSRFQDISSSAGEYFQTDRLGRGVAVGDLDNDGGCDLVISHNMGPVAVLRNETANRGHFLAIDLVGLRSSRTAFGARLSATIGDRSIVQVLPGGSSYLSANDHRVLIGLGSSAFVDSLEVVWPSGQRQRLKDLPANHRIRVFEGRAVPRPDRRVAGELGSETK